MVFVSASFFKEACISVRFSDHLKRINNIVPRRTFNSLSLFLGDATLLPEANRFEAYLRHARGKKCQCVYFSLTQANLVLHSACHQFMLGLAMCLRGHRNWSWYSSSGISMLISPTAEQRGSRLALSCNAHVHCCTTITGSNKNRQDDFRLFPCHNPQRHRLIPNITRSDADLKDNI